MRFILNVGPPKTGTTSIQHFIRDNATELGDQGIFVPQTDAPNMREFSLACDVTGVFRPSERGQNRLQTLLNLTRENYFDRIDSIRERLRQQLSDALRSNRFHTVIISSENLAYLGSSGVDIDTKLGALKDFLAEFGESFRILFALRRQDLISISRYSTAIKGNNVQTHEELLVHSSGMDLVRVLVFST